MAEGMKHPAACDMLLALDNLSLAKKTRNRNGSVYLRKMRQH